MPNIIELIFIAFADAVADIAAVPAASVIPCSGVPGLEAEALADKLSAAGFMVRVIRFGSGNGCLSGQPGNGVTRIEVIRKLDRFSCTTEQFNAGMDREAAKLGPISRPTCPFAKGGRRRSDP